MKNKIIFVYILIIFTVSISSSTRMKQRLFLSNGEKGGNITSVLNGAYLGQKSPGLEPEIFSPGFISLKDKIEYSSTFSPDGNEFYFSRLVAKEKFTIFVTKRTPLGWSKPEIAGFSGDYFNNEPYITPNGKRIYWGSKRPLPDGRTDYATWFMDRKERGWGEPKLFNFTAMYITSTNKGKLYFTDRGPGGAVIAWTSSENGNYGKKHWLGKPVISNYYDGHPCIAQDESFLIFDSENRPESKECGLFISFKNKDDNWSVPVNMNSVINKKASVAMITHDRKYLFFHAQGDIYWVDAKIINQLRQK